MNRLSSALVALFLCLTSAKAEKVLCYPLDGFLDSLKNNSRSYQVIGRGRALDVMLKAYAEADALNSEPPSTQAIVVRDGSFMWAFFVINTSVCAPMLTNDTALIEAVLGIDI